MMKIKRVQIFFIIVLLILGISACVRPASRPPTGDETVVVTEAGFPLPGTDVMGELESFATQTAIAMQGGGAPAATQAPVGGEATPGAPVVATEPPAAGATPEPQAVTETEAQEPEVSVDIPEIEVPRNYKLKAGEFPYCIARRFNVDPGELLRANGLGPNSATSAGLTLTIPQDSNFPGRRSLKSHPTTYTVQAGDTLSSIACTFGDVDPSQIAAANGIGVNKKLTSGQKLEIP